MCKKTILILFIIPFLCCSQNNPFQSFGTAITYVVKCPCKLFKYYENNELVYFCEDENNIQYKIVEKKYKDIIDRLINIIDNNLYSSSGDSSGSLIKPNENYIISSYFKENPNSTLMDFMGGEAVRVSEDQTEKLFFVDKNSIVTFEIIVNGINPSLVNDRFNQLINSVMLKSSNFKQIFKIW